MTRWKYIAAALAVFITGAGLGVLQAGQGAHTDNLSIETPAGSRAFRVEIADTQPLRETGLMFRKSMPRDHGMLFELDAKNPRVTSFWMKNTLIPLDMLFIGPKGDIVGIVRNAQPESLDPVGPGVPAAAILEINGGLADSLGIHEGDRVIHPFFQ